MTCSAVRRVLVAAASALLVGPALIGAAARGGAEPARPQPAASAARPAPALGVFVGTSSARLQAFESWLGRPLDVVVDFSARDTWEQISSPTYMLDEWRGTGLLPVYGVALLPEEDATATMRRGAAGDYDEHFRALARELVQADQGHAVLRLGWEFNVAGSRWGTDEPADFTAYWRRVVTAMRSVEGQAFRFDWNVNNGDGNRYDAVDYYPGDDVVDYVGVDVYDQSGRAGTYPYPAECEESCRRTRQDAAWEQQVFGGKRGLRFWRDFARQHGKPLSLPEWGLWTRPDATGGGDNPVFLARMNAFLADPANGVEYSAYFEHDGPQGQHTLRSAFPRSGEVFRSWWRPTAPVHRPPQWWDCAPWPGPVGGWQHRSTTGPLRPVACRQPGWT